MADVTVNIRGNASQLQAELEDVERRAAAASSVLSSSPAGTSPTSPPSPLGGRVERRELLSPDRMVEDVMAEMRRRGVVAGMGNDVSAIVDQYSTTLRGTLDNDITARYSARREALSARRERDYQTIEQDIESRYQSAVAELPDPNDPWYRKPVDDQFAIMRNAAYERIGRQYDTEEEQIDREEREERTQAEQELTAAIKELTDYFSRQSTQGGDPSNSYIGRLRQQQRELIAQRDAAPDEAGALAASRQLAEVNESLRRAMLGEALGATGGPDMLRGTEGVMSMVGGLSSGNISGAAMGAGTAIAGLRGMSMASSLKLLGWIGAAAGAIQTLVNTKDDRESLATLASLTRTQAQTGAETARALNLGLRFTEVEGVSLGDLGMNVQDFGQRAGETIRARGTREEGVQETVRQIALERSLAMSEGSLRRGGEYDRYGVNVTDALSQLVTILSNIEGSGVEYGDFTRVQEKYDIQQGIMASFMSRTDRPDYSVANQAVAAFSAIPGITQDRRLGSDYAAFQDAIQNPMNERMRVLLYGTVGDLIRDTGGSFLEEGSAERRIYESEGVRNDVIDRVLRNPAYEGRIMQAVLQQITAMYGGTESQMGYFVMKNLFPSISPDRLDAYVRAFSESGSEASRLLRGERYTEGNIERTAAQNASFWIKDAPGYLSSYSTTMKEINNKLGTIASLLSGTIRIPGIGIWRNDGARDGGRE